MSSFLNNSVRVYLIKLKIGMLLSHEQYFSIHRLLDICHVPLISPERFGIISWNFDNVNNISLKIFWHLDFKVWSICACIKCHFSKGLKLTDQVFYEKKTGLPNFQLTNMLWSWNVHWEYTLTNEVDCWRYWPDVVTLSETCFWF